MGFNPMTGFDDGTDQWGWGQQDIFTQSQLPQGGGAPPQAAPQAQAPAAPPTQAPPASGYEAFQAKVNPAAEQNLGHSFDNKAWYDQNAPTFANDPGWTDRYIKEMAGSDEAKAHAALRQPSPTPQAPPAGGGGGGFNNINPSAWFAQSPDPLAGRNTNQHADLISTLQGLYKNGGGFNQDIVNRRTENAKEDLFRQGKQTRANDEAALASRGLIGSGPEATAFDRRSQDFTDRYKNAVSGIYANESQNADQRMMSALQLAGGLDQNDAQNLINAYSSQTSRALGLGNLDTNATLGLGNLALGNMNGTNNYNLGLGRLGLDRDVAQNNADNTQLDQIIKLLEQLHGGAQTSSGGFF